MKTTSNRKGVLSDKDLKSEYRFDYSRARLNRFASRMKHGAVAVVLDPDVASVFQSSEAVNHLLRSVLSALPTQTKAGRA
jgi:hypothetical protein